MHRLIASLAICLAAVVIVGCGTVTASHPGPAAHSTPGLAAHSTAPAAPASTTPGTPASPAGARVPPGCQGTAPAAATTLVITLAGNGKTYCVRVGGKLRVDLRSPDASSWLPPLTSSGALVPVPDGTNSLVRGLTAGSFAAARPGQALLTSVRPPCEVKIPVGKGDLEPADPLPPSYPLRLCGPGHRFSASVIVVRLSWCVRQARACLAGIAAPAVDRIFDTE
jgi:hypothetical protein